jgi:predicted nucleic acid-binding protein
LIVVDASALLEMLLHTPRAARLIERAFADAERMHAPHLLDIEVVQVLRRLVQRKEIPRARAEQALEDLDNLVIERHAHQPLLSRVRQLRDSLTAYDGAYVALAEALEAPLLTCDAKLAGAHGHRASIELVAS